MVLVLVPRLALAQAQALAQALASSSSAASASPPRAQPVDGVLWNPLYYRCRKNERGCRQVKRLRQDDFCGDRV